MKLSKNDWEKIGEKAGWIKKSQNLNPSLTKNTTTLTQALTRMGPPGNDAITMLQNANYYKIICLVTELTNAQVTNWTNILKLLQQPNGINTFDPILRPVLNNKSFQNAITALLNVLKGNKQLLYDYGKEASKQGFGTSTIQQTIRTSK